MTECTAPWLPSQGVRESCTTITVGAGHSALERASLRSASGASNGLSRERVVAIFGQFVWALRGPHGTALRQRYEHLFCTSRSLGYERHGYWYCRLALSGNHIAARQLSDSTLTVASQGGRRSSEEHARGARWRLEGVGHQNLDRCPELAVFATLAIADLDQGVGHQYSDRGRRSSRCSPASERSPRIVFEGGA
jgi:hypothetical protein